RGVWEHIENVFVWARRISVSGHEWLELFPYRKPTLLDHTEIVGLVLHITHNLQGYRAPRASRTARAFSFTSASSFSGCDAWVIPPPAPTNARVPVMSAQRIAIAICVSDPLSLTHP